jgi:hypothetical protein
MEAVHAAFTGELHFMHIKALLTISSAVQGCGRNLPAQEYTGATERRDEPLFADPQLAWYNCRASK